MGVERKFEGPRELWQEAELTRENSNLYRVTITGDEVEWVARPGVNEDDDGNPQPWVATAQAQVTLRARDQEEAAKYALRANEEAGYHTVAEVVYVDEDEQ